MPVSALGAAPVFLLCLVSRKLRFKLSNIMKKTGVRTQMYCSETSVCVSASSSSKKDKKLKGVVSCMTESDSSIIKEDVTQSSVQIHAIRTDPGKLNRMTVNELRAITRSVGISSQGRKKDLVSALISFSCIKENEPVHGLEGEDMASMGMHRQDLPTKRKAKDSSTGSNVQNVVALSDATERKYKRSRKKQHSVESTGTEDPSTKKMVAIDESEVLDANKSSSRITSSLIIQSDEQVMDVAGPQRGYNEPWTMLAHKKPQAGWTPYNPKTMRPPHLSRELGFVKLMSWNVNGLRALLKMESSSVLQMAEREDFDVLCLQETKMKERDVEEIKDLLIDGYDNNYWTCSVSKLGYSGTAIISRIKPISVKYGLGIPDHDSEGRLVTAEFDTFYLINAYVPNSGDGLKRLDYRIKQWDSSLSKYMKELEQSKPVILTGDLNCAHEEIDIYNPAGNRRSAGFTWEERESFETNFLSKGFVDTFRKQHPNVVAYTYWGYRHGGRKTNKGWRLDYFLASESIADKAYDSYVVPEVGGSDHCPIGLVLKV